MVDVSLSMLMGWKRGIDILHNIAVVLGLEKGKEQQRSFVRKSMCPGPSLSYSRRDQCVFDLDFLLEKGETNVESYLFSDS
jgi:hypothetical protein